MVVRNLVTIQSVKIWVFRPDKKILILLVSVYCSLCVVSKVILMTFLFLLNLETNWETLIQNKKATESNVSSCVGLPGETSLPFCPLLSF